MFGLLLVSAGTGWVLTPASLSIGFAPFPVRGPLDLLQVVVLRPVGLLTGGTASMTPVLWSQDRLD